MGTSTDLHAQGPLVVGRLLPDEDAPMEGAGSALHLLVDTGAVASGIAHDVATALGLAVHGFTSIVGITQHELRVPVFEAALALWFEGDGPPRLVRIPLQLAGLPITYDGRYQGVLGRDFLADFDLHYLGPDGRFEIVQR
jgi:hypothetical protein